MHYERLEHENSATLNSAALVKCWIVQLSSATLIVQHQNSETSNSATINSAASNRATIK